MIIGKGLLAKSLSGVDHSEVTLFCSGVSDSGETSHSAFNRESDLLFAQPREQLLVYFSTISIFNPSKQHNNYIIHKKEIESGISENFKNHLILRLPNLVGQGGNKSNFFPFFFDSIQHEKHVRIHNGAKRDLLSANDLPKIVEALLKSEIKGTMNVCFSDTPEVSDIYLYMCKLLNKKPDFTYIKEEKHFTIDNTNFLNLIKINNLDLLSDWREIVDFHTHLLLKQSNFAKSV